MKVVIHSKPVLTAKYVRLFTYSITFKKFPKWVYIYDCEYYVERKRLLKNRFSIFNHVIERLYESTHDVLDCESCELIIEEDCYCETRRIMVEDRD